MSICYYLPYQETKMSDEVNELETSATGPMLYYNEIVLDHFTNPRNVGEMAEGGADGYARVGDPGCGDEMKLWFTVENSQINRICFKSYGCPGAISTSSMLTVLAKGKTIAEARGICDDDVVNALGGIPENKKHCSLLGVRALQEAIDAYERKQNGEQ